MNFSSRKPKLNDKSTTMKQRIYTGFITLLFFMYPGLYGQAQEIPELSGILEDMNIRPENQEYEAVFEYLNYLYFHPLDINKTPSDSLKKMVFLSAYQIDRLIEYRKRQNGFDSVNEILSVSGFNESDLKKIRPFITVGKRTGGIPLSKISRREALLRIRCSFPRREGYKKYSREDFKNENQWNKKERNRFLGPPFSALFKYKFKAGEKWSGHIILENDAGEPWFSQGQKMGFDYISASLGFHSGKILEKLYIGDFEIRWGEGITVWNGFSTGKSTNTTGVERPGSEIKPHTSVDENDFFRGIGTELRISENLSASFFFSHKKNDAGISAPDTAETEDFKSVSLYKSGLHRNRNELDKKHRIKETATGISLDYNHRYFKAGIRTVYYNLSPHLKPRERIYSRYEETGKNRCLASIDYKTDIFRFRIFGETGCTEKGRIAALNGIFYHGIKDMDIVFLHRYYARDYRSRYASAVGEYSNTSNEEGIYAGLAASPHPDIKINIYYDRFRFFSPRYNAYFPGSGNDFASEILWNSGIMKSSLRYKRKSRPENIGINKEVRSGRRRRNEIRLNTGFEWSRQIATRIRLDYADTRKNGTRDKGYMITHDITYNAPGKKFRGNFRLAWFDTDSYAARIYGYEHDVLYYFAFPAYYEKGMRTYANITYRPAKQFTVYLKTALTWYPGKDSIGSRLSKIERNKIFSLSLQLHYNFR